MKSLFFVFLLLAGLLAESADAVEPEFHWSVHENSGQTWGLSYAHPNSDVGLLWIWCQVGTKEVTITPALPALGIGEGEQGAITLSTTSKKLRIEGRAGFSEAAEAIEITASVLQPQELAAIFEGLGSLRIAIPGNHTTLPLNGESQNAFAEFRRRCGF